MEMSWVCHLCTFLYACHTTHTEASGHSCVLEKWPLPSFSALWPRHIKEKKNQAQEGLDVRETRAEKQHRDPGPGEITQPREAPDTTVTLEDNHGVRGQSADLGAAALQRAVSPAALSWHLRPGLGRVPSTPPMEMSSCLFLGCLNKQRGLC